MLRALVGLCRDDAGGVAMPPVCHMKLVNWRTSQTQNSLAKGPVLVHPTLVLAGDWAARDSTFGSCAKIARIAVDMTLRGVGMGLSGHPTRADEPSAQTGMKPPRRHNSHHPITTGGSTNADPVKVKTKGSKRRKKRTRHGRKQNRNQNSYAITHE